MKPDHETLREAGEAMFGPHWQTPMSEALGVTDRTVRRWTAGEFMIPHAIWGELAKLCRDRGQSLDRLAARLERE